MQSVKLFRADFDIKVNNKVRFIKGNIYTGVKIDYFFIRIYDEQDQGWDFGLTYKEVPSCFWLTETRYPEKFTLLSKNILMPNKKEFRNFRKKLR